MDEVLIRSSCILLITATISICIGLRDVEINWSHYVPSKATLMGFWPTSAQLSKCYPRFHGLRQWISRRREKPKMPYTSVGSGEQLVKEEEIKEHVSDSESDLGEPHEVFEKV